MILAPGTKAPDFTLKQGPDKQLRLSDLRGRPVVLMFYPADFSPVCGDELALFNEVLEELEKYDAQVVGISVDGPWCHSAYAKQKNLAIPLLSDFEPKGEVSRKYGVYREQDGVSERALFVIDADGIIRWIGFVNSTGFKYAVDTVLANDPAVQARRAADRAYIENKGK